MNGAAARSVDAQGQQVCAEGLEHGKTYRVSIRQGLPSAVGEVLEAPVSLQVYVRDRAPAVRFTGDSYVLPASGRHGIPLVSVNTSSATLQVYRVGDRGVSRLLGESKFLRQLEGYDASRLADEIGEPVWTGTIDIASELNREVTTSFPVSKAVPVEEARRLRGHRGAAGRPARDVGGPGDPVVRDLRCGVVHLHRRGWSQRVRSQPVLRIAPDRNWASACSPQQRGTWHCHTDQNGRASFAAGLVRGTGRHGARRHPGAQSALTISCCST